MANLITLSRVLSSGKTVDYYVNAEAISHFYRSTDHEITRIYIVGVADTAFSVKETPDEIITLIQGDTKQSAPKGNLGKAMRGEL